MRTPVGWNATRLAPGSALLALLAAACSREPPAAQRPPPPIASLPVEITLRQRGNAAVPGAVSELVLAIGDVTRGHVTTSLLGTDGAPVLAPLAMKPRDRVAFEFHAVRHHLELRALHDVLLGADSATFVIHSDQADDAANGAAAIEALLLAIENARDVVFLRNGGEHSPSDAAAHLRRKLAASDEVVTAEQFITQIATRSSLSGEEYRIRHADGRVEPLATYLRAALTRPAAK
jgi:hypothetical protein